MSSFGIKCEATRRGRLWEKIRCIYYQPVIIITRLVDKRRPPWFAIVNDHSVMEQVYIQGLILKFCLHFVTFAMGRGGAGNG